MSLLAERAFSTFIKCTDIWMQMEANKRREAELQKLRRDLEDAHAQNESQVSALRKKQQDTINEMSEQLEALQKLKQKYNIFTSSQTYSLGCTLINNTV